MDDEGREHNADGIDDADFPRDDLIDLEGEKDQNGRKRDRKAINKDWCEIIFEGSESNKG